jgi:hypothetical protein
MKSQIELHIKYLIRDIKLCECFIDDTMGIHKNNTKSNLQYIKKQNDEIDTKTEILNKLKKSNPEYFI